MTQSGTAQQPPEQPVNALIGLLNQGRFGEVIAHAGGLLETYPDAFVLWNVMGIAYAKSGQFDAAVRAFTRACALNPALPDAHYNLGNALQAAGQIDAAIASYHQALARNPAMVMVYNNLGNALKALGRLDEAASAYQHALGLRPDFAEAHNNLGIVLNDLGKLDQAVAAYHRALTLNPAVSGVYYNLGSTLRALGQRDQAIAAFRQALALQPDYAEAEAQLLHQLQHICDWRGFDDLPKACARLAAHRDMVAPFTFLAMVDDAKIQLQLSGKYATTKFTEAPQPVPPAPSTRPARLRIGYFSADFFDHATLFLMAGLLRMHDRSRFEVFAYSYGRAPAGAWGDRARGDVDRFIDVTDQPARSIADLARSHQLDIAIDLKGYTDQGRTDLFQHRLAPVQIAYLGYPGTLATGFIDYLVADPVVIPDDQRAFYTERLIYLPHSYQPNDNTREIAATTTTRADFGLPDAGFVFCCFNGSYKISPREFDIWMDLLGSVDGSVLWLLKSNPWCEDNLRNAAAARGIAPDRLIFAPPVDHAQHLARHRHADVFLDTFNCNAHTTASDALWAGLPVITKAGRQFAARVAASLLMAVGLPELIAHTEADYAALALTLATDPDRLAAIKARLAANRQTHPLFDTARYTRLFEAGLDHAYEIHLAGECPRDIRISD